MSGDNEDYREDIEEEDYNADDREQVNRARKKAARQRIIFDEVIRGVMAVKEFRQWIYHIIQETDMFGDPHVIGDTNSTFINIGRSNMGKFLWQELENAAPEFCMTMLKEAKKNAKQQEG